MKTFLNSRRCFMPEAAVIPVAGDGLTEAADAGSIPTMVWQHPLSLKAEELVELLDQAELSVEEFMPKLLDNTYQVYRVANVLALVVALPSKLVILGMSSVGKNSLTDFKALARGLRHLARAWGLPTIETSAYDPAVKRLLEMVGAKPIGWHMELRV